MKKVFLLISTLFVLSVSNSCSENELELTSPTSDGIESIDTEDKLQKFLNGAYLSVGSVNAFGTTVTAIGDVLSDHLYVSSAGAAAFSSTYNMNYSAVNNDFGFYDSLYNAINNCNMIINNTKVENNENVAKIKAQAKIIRALAYFTLVNYYSPAPTSGINQEYGVPLVLANYDASIQPARATVAEVYAQIISDLTSSLSAAEDPADNKVLLGKTAAKLLLSRVYLTRRAAGDAQLALQYASDIVNNPGVFAPIESTLATYQAYFSGSPEANSENRPETIWELDINTLSNGVTGLGSNLALPTLYYRLSDRKALLFTKEFYDSFPAADVRKGSGSTGLLTTTGVTGTGTVPGAWTNKYPRLTEEGNFQRNIKILRFAEAQLNRIEALYLTGQETTALTELNAFALSRKGSTYPASTGTALLNNILTEKGKEFYGEGQRFLDLKRWNLPIVKTSNCTTNCNVPANDKLFVLPIGQDAINNNINLKQYPGY
ncbi:RagB/SusD family nutrient uptake outer membrane protein [Epilithonimonas sp. UC225_85]|uniref:RagB/SusD family nutrient uptake outer membrane protein n=1 Tax=Epilithonimonas sp. UC225_85 TaxID=3350167 RepID=UPI0036D22376